MDLSAAEMALIDIIRDPAVPVFAISLTSTEAGFLVTMAMPGDGVNVGSGRTFEAAFFRVCGRELAAGRLCGEPDASQH